MDLDAAAIDLAAAVAGLAPGGAAGEHAVLGAEPALASADQEGRDGQVHAAGTQDLGAAHLHQHAAGGLAREVAAELQGADLIGLAAVPTIVITASEVAADDRVPLRPEGWLEKPFRFDTLLELVKRYVQPV